MGSLEIKKRVYAHPPTTQRSSMKKCSKTDVSKKHLTTQEKINELNDDLMTVLDGHMDEMEMDEVFYNALKFMTFAMYECLDDHRLALKTLKLAMDQGIQMHMDKKEEPYGSH